MGEIQAIIRQITASVTFLPLLQDACTFDLLIYTDNDVSVPQAWEESDPKYINNQQEVKLLVNACAQLLLGTSPATTPFIHSSMNPLNMSNRPPPSPLPSHYEKVFFTQSLASPYSMSTPPLLPFFHPSFTTPDLLLLNP